MKDMAELHLREVLRRMGEGIRLKRWGQVQKARGQRQMWSAGTPVRPYD